MNLSEFKAWFEGFTEMMDGPPNAKQWKRIAKRVSEITNEPTPWPIFRDVYIPRYPRYQWEYVPSFTTLSGASSTISNSSAGQVADKTEMVSTTAFVDLGKAEWQSMAN